MIKSHLEETFLQLLKTEQAKCIPKPRREYVFAPPRRWKFDFAFLMTSPIAIELEGGIWIRGAHTRGKHFISDCDKYNKATVLGWRVLRFTGNHLKERPLECIEIIKELINER